MLPIMHKKEPKFPLEAEFAVGDLVEIKPRANELYRNTTHKLDTLIENYNSLYGKIIKKCNNGFCIVQVHRAADDTPLYNECFFYEQLIKF